MIEFDRRDDLDVLGYEGMSQPPTFFAENYSAAFKNVEALEMTNSKPLLLARYWDEKFERLQEVVPDAIGSGYVFEEGADIKLHNPAPYVNRTIFDYLPLPGAADPFLLNTIGSKFGLPVDTSVSDTYQHRANKIYKFIQDNQDILPDDLKTLTPENVAADIDQMRRDAREEFEDVSSRSVGAGGFTGRLAGGAVASFKDPVIQGTSIVGGMYGTGKSLLRLALIEAALGGGASAITQPKIKEWYDELGYDYTYKDFLRNVSIDAIASAGLGVGINLTARSVSKGWNAFKTTDNANPESQALANAADDAVDLEQSNPLENPDTPGSQVEHEQRLTEATHSLQSGKAPDLTNEPVNNVNYGKTDEEIIDSVENLEGVIFKIEAERVIADPKRFQFKSNTDEFGVGDRLKDEVEWNPHLSGTVMFWEDLDGKIFIADGHQRLGLAKRIMSKDPSKKISLYGTLLREADGHTAEHAKVLAAAKNITEATDNEQLVIDAAKILRVHTDLDEAGIKLPPRSSVVVQGRAIATLNEEAFGAVINGVIPGNYASVVGRLISPDQPDLQNAAIALLSKSQPKNMTEAEFITREVIASGVTKETQETLFGDEVFASSLVLERARIIDETQKLLRADKNAFRNLTQNAERIEAEGNKLVKSQNERLANENAQAIALLQTLSTRKGQLSDELTEAARRAKETGNFKVAARDYAEAVRRGIERGDFDRATTSDLGRAIDDPPEGGIGKSEEQLFDDFDEPTGPGVERQTEQMIQDAFRTVDEAEEPDSLANLKFLLGTNPTREQIENHPAVVNAVREINSRQETINAANYDTPEWHQNRVYNIEGEEVVGTEAALIKFEQQAERLAYKELGLAPGTIARNKELTIILGPPAAGKSTIANEIAVANRSAILDSDEIKKTLPEFEGGKGTGAVHEESSNLSKGVQDRLIDSGTNITLPKVGHEVSSIRKAVSLYKERGYKVRLLYMDVTPENAINRMLGRFVDTGRFIDLEYLDFVGTKPGETFRILRKEGAADGYAKIDNNGEFDAPKTVSEISGDNPLKGSRFDIPEGGRTRPGTLRRAASDTKEDEITNEIDFDQEDLDLEIPFSFDAEGNAVGKTLRDIKKDIDADDALIRRLEVCGL